MVTTKRAKPEVVFKAIADPTRREILGLLRTEARTVGGIASHFHISRPAISKHLRLLRSAGLVVTRKRGTTNICELNAKPLHTVHEWLRDYEAFWDETLRNLKQYVEENPCPTPATRSSRKSSSKPRRSESSKR